jgi:UDP-GlcNAc:undecaprenyl-phosphate GlcNAc-1-phosphate transferase
LAAFLFILVSNAVNLQDGLDGLAGGVVLISLIGFSIFFVFSGNIFLFLVTAAIIGAITSFMFFNWTPASMFLGNNGSYLLGFLVAFMAIMASSPSRFFYSLSPLFLIGTPLLNVAYVFSKRLLAGRSPFSADRNHIHDDLFRGINSTRGVVLTIYSIQLVSVVVGLILLLNF